MIRNGYIYQFNTTTFETCIFYLYTKTPELPVLLFFCFYFNSLSNSSSKDIDDDLFNSSRVRTICIQGE